MVISMKLLMFLKAIVAAYYILRGVHAVFQFDIRYRCTTLKVKSRVTLSMKWTDLSFKSNHIRISLMSTPYIDSVVYNEFTNIKVQL